jgi:hypothetical protein
LLIKIQGQKPVTSGDYFALFFVPPESLNDSEGQKYVDELQQKHGFQLGWMYKVHKNSQADFQIEPFFRTTFAPSPYELQLPAGRENDKLYEYDFGYKSLERLAAKKGHLKVVLIPGRVTLMPLFFKPDDLFSSNSNELQVASDKECFAAVAGVRPGAVFCASIIPQIRSVRDSIVRHLRLPGSAHGTVRDAAVDPLAVFSFCSNKITDPTICCMLLSCCEDIAAVLSCTKKSQRQKSKQDGLLYTHPDQMNVLWKLYGTGLSVEAYNRLAHSSKAYSHAVHHISQQEVVDLALKIHFVERLGSIFDIQQRFLLQCFDAIENINVPQPPSPQLFVFLHHMKAAVVDPGVDDLDDKSVLGSGRGRKVFRMPQNVSRIIRKLLRMNPPFHKSKCFELISDVVLSASASLSLISRFIKLISLPSKPLNFIKYRDRHLSLSAVDQVQDLNTSFCIFQLVRLFYLLNCS